MRYQLIIDGVEMPSPVVDGIEVKDEKIWSSDTGRISTGKMVGTVIGIKHTIRITWPRLTAAQAKRIRSAVSSKKSFVVMAYTDIDGERVSKTVYFDTPSFTIHRLWHGEPVITGCTVQGIEQ